MIDKVKKVKSYRLYKKIELEINEKISDITKFNPKFNFQLFEKIIIEVIRPYNLEYKIDYQYDLSHDEISIILENEFVIKIIKHIESYSV